MGNLISDTYDGHAMALSALDVANGDIDLGAGSQGFISSNAEGNILAAIGSRIFFISGLLIAVLPLWINAKD